jgi:hypothetical protein
MRTQEAAMSAIAGEHIGKAPTSALTRVRLKWLAYVTLGGLVALAGAVRS